MLKTWAQTNVEKKTNEDKLGLQVTAMCWESFCDQIGVELIKNYIHSSMEQNRESKAMFH